MCIPSLFSVPIVNISEIEDLISWHCISLNTKYPKTARRDGNEVLVYFTVEWGNSLYNWVKLHLRFSKLETIPNLLHSDDWEG